MTRGHGSAPLRQLPSDLHAATAGRFHKAAHSVHDTIARESKGSARRPYPSNVAIAGAPIST